MNYDELEAALRRFIDQTPVLTADGRPTCWADGTPCAVAVVNALVALDALDRIRK